MKFAKNGTLYRGSKPVMWSVVEKTALAEAEVEYEDYQSDTVWVKFPVKLARADGKRFKELEQKYDGASVVIWTTTPWTLPGNRAISYSPQDRIRSLQGHRCRARQLGEVRRSVHPVGKSRRRRVQAGARHGL